MCTDCKITNYCQISKFDSRDANAGKNIFVFWNYLFMINSFELGKACDTVGSKQNYLGTIYSLFTFRNNLFIYLVEQQFISIILNTNYVLFCRNLNFWFFKEKFSTNRITGFKVNICFCVFSMDYSPLVES